MRIFVKGCFLLLGTLFAVLPVHAYLDTENITVTFRQSAISGSPALANPQYGTVLNHPGLPQSMLTSGTIIHFSFESTTTQGDLVFMLKNKRGREFFRLPPTQGPLPSPIYEEYLQMRFPLSQSGPTYRHTIDIGQVIQDAGIQWGQEIYMAFFAEVEGLPGEPAFSETSAYFNNFDFGRPWVNHNLRSPEFSIPVIYDKGTHPNLPIATLSEGSNSHGFTNLGTTINGKTVHGALSNYFYELKDDAITANAFPLGDRIWELYQIGNNGTDLTLVQTIPGQGELGISCHFQVPEHTENGTKYLLLCRTVDATGHASMAQPTTITDPGLGANGFVFEVGKDVTKNPENCLAVSTSTNPAGQGPFTPPQCGTDKGIATNFHFMPLGNGDFDTQPGTTDRVVWEIFLNDTQTSISSSEPLDTTNIGSWPWVDPFGEADFPIHIKWGYTNAYGTTAYKTVASIEYYPFDGDQFPAQILQFEWDQLPNSLQSGTALDLRYQINTHYALPYMYGTFWIYNPNNPSQNVRLEDPAGASPLWLLPLYGDVQALDSLVLPSQVATWGLLPGSKLRIRMKAVWSPDSTDITLDPFLTQFNGPENDPFRKYRTEETEDWEIPDTGGGHFLSLTDAGSGQVIKPSGKMDLILQETHTGQPSPLLSWRWETLVGNQRYLWLGQGWQAIDATDDTWVEIDTGYYNGQQVDPFSSRWQWIPSSGEIAPKILQDPSIANPLANDGQTPLLEPFFTPTGQGPSQSQIEVQLRVRMSYGSRHEYQTATLHLHKVLPQAGSFDSLITQGPYQVLTPSGDMAFHFQETHTGNPDPDLRWRWETTDGNYIWIENAWWPVANYEDIWVAIGTGDFPGGTDIFSGRWEWHPTLGQIVPTVRSQPNTSPPLADDGQGNSLLNEFFTLPGNQSPSESVDVRVRVLMGFNGNFEEESLFINQLTLHQPESGVEAFQFSLAKAATTPICGESSDWLEANDYIGRLGNLPRMQFTLTTTGSQIPVTTLRIEKQTSTGDFTQISCHDLNGQASTALFASSCQNTPAIGENLQRWWVADQDTDPNVDNLFDVLASHGAGTYRLRLTTKSCSQTSDSNASVILTLNPAESFALRIHYRDHIGSSSISRAYTPSLTGVVGNTTPFRLKVGSQSLALYAQTPEWTHYEPFGKTWNNVNSEPDPRYTDHEYDMQSGFNYMKGRYQLPTYGRFNRPDPARDWDWENPSSINLFQYVRNNPIYNYDPTGLDRYYYDTSGNVEVDENKWWQFWRWGEGDRFFFENVDGSVLYGDIRYTESIDPRILELFKLDPNTQIIEIDDNVNYEVFSNMGTVADGFLVSLTDILETLEKSPQGGEWDYKHLTNGALEEKKAYLLDGMLWANDSVGNIVWGAIMSSHGWPLQISTFGAGIQQLRDHDFEEFKRNLNNPFNAFDDKRDTISIIYGYYWFEKNEEKLRASTYLVKP